jgi:hypothetical protein
MSYKVFIFTYVKPIKPNEMNQIKEVLDTDTQMCGEMDLFEMFHILKDSNKEKTKSWKSLHKLIGIEHNNTKKHYVWYMRMGVSGKIHKGYVYIFLNKFNLFDVILTNYEDKISDRTDEMGINKNQLIEWIDLKIDRIIDFVI